MELQTVHKDKMISKFPPPWNFKLTWTARKDEVISTFPPPWELQTVHKDKIYKNPNPMELQIDLDCPRG